MAGPPRPPPSPRARTWCAAPPTCPPGAQAVEVREVHYAGSVLVGVLPTKCASSVGSNGRTFRATREESLGSPPPPPPISELVVTYDGRVRPSVLPRPRHHVRYLAPARHMGGSRRLVTPRHYRRASAPFNEKHKTVAVRVVGVQGPSLKPALGLKPGSSCSDLERC